jgi:hypothetical protein
MTAAGIAPQSGGMVFSSVALLDQQLPPGVEDKDGKGPVQDTLDMGGYFLGIALFVAVFINKNNLFSHNILLSEQILASQ